MERKKKKKRKKKASFRNGKISKYTAVVVIKTEYVHNGNVANATLQSEKKHTQLKYGH